MMKNIYTSALIPFAVFCLMLISAFSNAQNNGIPPEWEFQTSSSNPHGMIIMLDANPRINEIPLQPGDYIGAFFTDNSGELVCGGADFWAGDENIIFAVFGDDPETPEKDGFGYNEQMFFKVFSWDNQKAYDVDITAWDPEYYSTYHWSPLGLSAMTDLQCLVDFDAFASANPDPACLGNDVTLTANIFVESTGSYSYNWTSDPAGFTSTDQETLATPGVTTTYFLEVSDGNLISNHELLVVVNEDPMVSAGEDMTICQDCNALLSATVQNYSSVFWQTAGDGTFCNTAATNPTYFPGPQDIQSGGALLTIIANPLTPCNALATDEINIAIQSVPVIGIQSALDYCGSDNIILDADAENYASINWSTGGDGTFSNPDSEITQYFPGTYDMQLGEFTLEVCAEALLQGQSEVCTEIDVTIYDPPTVNAPSSLSKCDNQPIPVTCIPNNYINVNWITTGDGTFENSGMPSTYYYTGENDRVNGGTTIIVEVFGDGPCQQFPVTKNISIILSPSPVVDAGDNQMICSNENVQLEGSVENHTYFMWTTSGDGYFSNTIIENPIYFPGANDALTGNFTLTLNAYPIYPCTATVIDELFMEIVGEPAIEITTGNNQVFPLGEPLNIIAEGTDYQSLMWETSGDGTFSDPSELTPLYTPGPVADASGNPVILSVTAYAATGCGTDVSDQITVSFTQQANVNAGNDITACEDGANLNGVTMGCNSVLWTTSGDGTFADANSAVTTYFAGNGDIATGYTEVCLTGYFENNQSISDYLNISISGNPQLIAGFDQLEACHSQPVEISLETAENYSSIFWYTTNGGGNFCNIENGSVVYNPAPTVDYPQGCITIFALAQPVAPCSLVDEINFEVCFHPNPELDPGFDQTKACHNQPVEINLETAENFSSIFWYTTNGGGTFDNHGDGTATYYPAPTVDYPQGCISIFALAQPIAPCVLVDETNFELCFQPNPQADAGADQTIAETDIFIPDPVISGQGSVLWETSGDGTFSDAAALSPQYYPGNNDISNQGTELTITAFPTSGCSLTATDQLHLTILNIQTVLLPEGWSGFSSYIESNAMIEDFFEPIEDLLVSAQTITEVYWPDGGINTIGVFSNESGYKVRVSQATEFSITGSILTNRTVNLNNGWNLIPVLSTCYVSQDDFLSMLGDNLLLVKEIAGNGIIWPDMNIFNISALIPGKAYLIAVNQADSFTYAECNTEKSGYVASTLPQNSPWMLPEQTTISHTIAITSKALKNLEPGDFIGAFNSIGNCVGLTEITTTDENSAITIYGDEPLTTAKEGMEAGESIRFKTFHQHNQAEQEIDIEYNTNYRDSDGRFSENGISVIESIAFKSTSVFETGSSELSMYPNPTHGLVNISAGNPSSEFRVTINNINGNKIIEEHCRGTVQIDLSAIPKGFYLVTITRDSYQKIEKLVIE